MYSMYIAIGYCTPIRYTHMHLAIFIIVVGTGPQTLNYTACNKKKSGRRFASEHPEYDSAECAG